VRAYPVVRVAITAICMAAALAAGGSAEAATSQTQGGNATFTYTCGGGQIQYYTIIRPNGITNFTMGAGATPYRAYVQQGSKAAQRCGQVVDANGPMWWITVD
jgi:hypothetical protein